MRVVDVTTVRVRCTFELDVKVPSDWDDDQIRFDIEENHCPGTGIVGAALDALIADADRTKTCWACPRGKNEIVMVTR